MFRYIKSFLLLMMLTAFAFSATHYNEAVTVTIVPGGVIYSGTIDMTGDSTGTYYTKAFDVTIQDRTNLAWINVICSNVAGTEDVNGFLFYSNAENPTVANGVIGPTDGDLDAIGTTAKIDTASIQAGSPRFRGSRWCSVKIIGQSGNPLTTFSWWIFVPCSGSVDLYKFLTANKNRLVASMPAS